MSSSKKKKPTRSEKAYQTYVKWYNKVSKTNKMSESLLSKADFELMSEMYRTSAKEVLKNNPNDQMALRAIKNITRFIAYDQTEYNNAQVDAIFKGLKDLKLKTKIKKSDIKKKGSDYVKSLLPEDIELNDVFDLGSA